MGICYAEKARLTKKEFSGELYSNFDKIIFLQKFFMENNLTKEEISPFFTTIIFEQILEEKIYKTKYNRFFKWIEKAFFPYNNLLTSLKKESVLKTLNIEKNKILKKQAENEENSTYSEIPNFSQDISISEQGLRNYYFSNQLHFENRIIKSPPASFRWTSWIISSGVPISRPAIYYTNLLTYDLPEKVEDQIQKDLDRTTRKDDINYKEKISSLYRLLRAMATLDKDMGYTQGMNFLVYYLLDISNRNEIDVFYLLMTIFSRTFSKKFGMRGFFIEGFPLLYCCTDIFDRKLNNFLPVVHKHIKKLNLENFFWISFWMQQIYTLIFPKEVLLRIWDYFFVYGINFLISLGISIIDYFQEEILKIKDIVEFQEFFKFVNKKGEKKDSIEYDIEKILKNSIEKYFITIEEIENELKNKFPNFNNDFSYDYKSIESNPEVKSEYVIYALNNSKALLSNRNKFSTSYESTLRNSSKFNKSEQKNDLKCKINGNNNINEKENNKKISIVSQEVDFEFDIDFIEENDEDDDDIQMHIKDIISKQNNVIYSYKK